MEKFRQLERNEMKNVVGGGDEMGHDPQTSCFVKCAGASDSTSVADCGASTVKTACKVDDVSNLTCVCA